MKSESSLDEGFVSFPVPIQYLPVVIQALAKAMEASTIGSKEAVVAEDEQITNQEATDAGSIDWTNVANMKKLRRGLSLPIGIKLLDLTAAHPGEMVAFEKLYKASGFTESRRARSSIGALTKVIKRDFGVVYEKANWPVEHHWGVNGDAQYSYCMRPEVAKAWLASAQ